MLTKIIIDGYKSYLKASIIGLKRCIIAAFVIFITGIAIGIYDLLNVNDTFLKIFGELTSKFHGNYGIILFLMILYQNLRATAVIVFSGILFSVLPIIASLFNGIIIGCVFSNLEHSDKLTQSKAVLYTIPHGIFEIPAILFALSLGIKFGLWPLKEHKFDYIKTNFIRSVQFYIMIILPLLVIAAIIETTTVQILSN